MYACCPFKAYLLLLLCAQRYFQGSPIWVRFLHMWQFFNPTIEVVTFHLHGWCMLGVFLLLAFTHLGHECQDVLGPEVPTLPFWAEDLPLYVISPVLPFDRKISRWRKLKIFRSFYPFPNCPAIAFFIENIVQREKERGPESSDAVISIFSASQGHVSSEPINAQHPQ